MAQCAGRRNGGVQAGNNNPVAHVSATLSESNKACLSALFPEIVVEFSDSAYHNHGMAMALRRCEYTFLMYRVIPRGASVVDVGGNVGWTTMMRIANLHTCAPLIDLRDQARHTNSLDMIVQRCRRNAAEAAGIVNDLKIILESNQPSEFSNVFGHIGRYVCARKTQHCNHPGDYITCVHGAYDITYDDWPLIMRKHNTKVAYLTMLFSPDMMCPDITSGELLSVGARYVIDRAADTITFAFVGDPSSGYCHCFSNYVQYFSPRYPTRRTKMIHKEIMSARNDVYFIKFTNVKNSMFRRTKNVLMHTISDKLCDRTIVKTFECDYGCRKMGAMNRVKQRVFIVSSAKINRLTNRISSILENSLPKHNDLNLGELVTYYTSLCGRITVNGNEISREEQQPYDETILIVKSCVFYVQCRRLFNGEWVSVCKAYLDQRKTKAEGTIAQVFMMWFKSKYCSVYNSFVEFFKSFLPDVELNEIDVSVTAMPQFIHMSHEHNEMFFKAFGHTPYRPDFEADAAADDGDNVDRNIVPLAELRCGDELLVRKFGTVGDNDCDDAGDTDSKSTLRSGGVDPSTECTNISSSSSQQSSDSVKISNNFDVTCDVDSVDRSNFELLPKSETHMSECDDSVETRPDSGDVRDEPDLIHRTVSCDAAVNEYIEYLTIEKLAVVSSVEGAVRVLRERFKRRNFDVVAHATILHTGKGAPDILVRQHENEGRYRSVRFGKKSYKPMGSFDVYYEADTDSQAVNEFVPGVYDDETDSYVVESNANFLIVCDGLKIFQAPRILNRIANRDSSQHRAKVTLVDGVPGSGKSTEIIDRAFAESRTKRVLILTVARATKLDLCEKVRKKFEGVERRPTVRTVDSYILNDNEEYDCVFLDEGLMIHAACIHLVCAWSKAIEVYVYGDALQIPFLSRNRMVTKHHDYKDFDNTEYRNHSFRCPIDVAARWASLYCAPREGFVSSNAISHSLVFNKGNTNGNRVLEHVKSTKPDIVVTFKQAEKYAVKKLLRSVGCDVVVATVHEVQGMTFEYVVCVRQSEKNENIYTSIPHILVAMTRHTRRFVYMSPVDDKLSGVIALPVCANAYYQSVNDLKKKNKYDVLTVNAVTRAKVSVEPAISSSSCRDEAFDNNKLEIADSGCVIGSVNDNSVTSVNMVDMRFEDTVAAMTYNHNYLYTEARVDSGHERITGMRCFTDDGKAMSSVSFHKFLHSKKIKDDSDTLVIVVSSGSEVVENIANMIFTKARKLFLPSALVTDEIVHDDDRLSGRYSKGFRNQTKWIRDIVNESSNSYLYCDCTGYDVISQTADLEVPVKADYNVCLNNFYELIVQIRPNAAAILLAIDERRQKPVISFIDCELTIPVFRKIGSYDILFSTRGKAISTKQYNVKNIVRWIDEYDANCRGKTISDNLGAVQNLQSRRIGDNCVECVIAENSLIPCVVAEVSTDTVIQHVHDLVLIRDEMPCDCGTDDDTSVVKDVNHIIDECAKSWCDNDSEIEYRRLCYDIRETVADYSLEDRQCGYIPVANTGPKEEVAASLAAWMCEFETTEAEVCETVDAALKNDARAPRDRRLPLVGKTADLYGIISMMQEAYGEFVDKPVDSVLYDNELMDQTHMQINTDSLVLNDETKITAKTLDRIYHPERCINAPKLRTFCPLTQVEKQSALLFAVNQRNFNPPDQTGDVDEMSVAIEAVENMITRAMIPEARAIFEEYREKPLRLTVADLNRWANEHDAAKLARIVDPSTPYEDADICRYNLAIKPDAKSGLAGDVVGDTIPIPQTIIHHEPKIGVVMSAIFSVVAVRLQAVLRPNVYMHTRRSNRDMADFLNTHVKGELTDYVPVELDISKYDKSQKRLVYLIEKYLYSLVGLDIDILHSWIEGHEKTIVRSQRVGILACIDYQRKSGDATTLLGNTILNLVSACYVLQDFSESTVFMFIGDDSLSLIKKTIARQVNVASMLNQYAVVFNFEAKYLMSLYCFYFSSCILIRVCGFWKVVPDPIKRLEKLGKHMNTNATAEELATMYISYRELIDPIRECMYEDGFYVALAERYPGVAHEIMNSALICMADSITAYAGNIAPMSADLVVDAYDKILRDGSELKMMRKYKLI